jgi:hypothetical protein
VRPEPTAIHLALTAIQHPAAVAQETIQMVSQIDRPPIFPNDPNKVENRFRKTRDNIDRVLTIDTTNSTARTHQLEDVIFRSMAGQIMLRAKREKTWPQNRVIAS